MPSFREAHLRHAAYYNTIAVNTSGLFLQGHESLRIGLTLFDQEWGNILAGQAWAAAHTYEDDAAQLCISYALNEILELRLRPPERVR